MIEINDTNLDEVFNKIVNDLFDKEKLKQAVGRGCLYIEKDAKEKCPKGDTGLLAQSIETTVSVEGNTVRGVVGSPLEYAPYVEYGTGLFAEGGDGRKDAWSYQDEEGNWHTTSGQKPQPFLRPAFFENEEKVVEKIVEGIIK